MHFPEFQQRHVLVTGGANGIGAAIVRAFHEQGASVFFCDNDAKAGRVLAKELGHPTFFSEVNLMAEKEVVRWIGRVGAGGRRIHVLVNNAASDPRIPLHQTTVAEWDGLFARNLRAYFLTAREATRGMRNGAAIVNLASVTFHNAPANMTAYVATKAGILGFTRSLARELGPRRIRVNALSPGWVMTERQLREYVTPAAKKLIRTSQCIPDLIQPQDIASVAVFLASDASRAITGQEILVDRGWEHS
jgi:NAD(P)-dependent dehydrogenase (short-subunit alcohol dehydrogenase family)